MNPELLSGESGRTFAEVPRFEKDLLNRYRLALKAIAETDWPVNLFGRNPQAIAKKALEHESA